MIISSSSSVGTRQGLWGDDEVWSEDDDGVWDDGGVELEDVEATGSEYDEDDDKELDCVRKLDLVTRRFSAYKKEIISVMSKKIFRH